MFRRVDRWRREARSILRRAEHFHTLKEKEFRDRFKQLRWQARGGAPLRRLLHDVYASGIVASHRVLGMTHFEVQVMGAIALFEGNIAEMQTGEGKTLTAVLPALLRGIVGRGTHVVTSNDYLAKRDAETMGQVYKHLDLTTGCVLAQMPDDERKKMYDSDITYGTASEMGFDFLRDRLKKGAGTSDYPQRKLFDRNQQGDQPVQRGHYFALIDESDSILIDEARTPLIIGVSQQNRAAQVALYRWCRDSISKLALNEDFIYDDHKRVAHLTDPGCRHVTLMAKPVLLDTIDTERIYQHIEKALTAKLAYQLGRDYIVDEGEIVIVDEGTGRKMEGRKWQEGLHQSVEAKEFLDVTEQTGSAATITIQSFYQHYEHLAGMTGTATQARREFKRVYKIKVCVIPTNRPCVRKGLKSRVFPTQAHKYEAIVKDVKELIQHGRAVLIGTPSVTASESLAEVLKAQGIPHQVLNARFHEQEADIVKHAGEKGKVMIATNMAGRGTDIILDKIVREHGGLHVIATEMHSSKRIDRQLVGRSARQGDPGSFRFYLSLQDELLRVLSPRKREKLLKQALRFGKTELGSNWLRLFKRVQKKIEKLDVKTRKQLLKREKEQRKKFREIGLDPYLEMVQA